jgi:RNA 3'-terminal phosphate cyclase (ATP)
MEDLIQIDGSIGGGQILRSALSLSALTGKAFVIEHIRKQRSRPGLMRQHLTAVNAASEICDAHTSGAELGSTDLTFRPGKVRPGSYHFAISTAGSACLVLQTVLPPLMVASAPSELSFEGGTHNPLAPPYPFLDQVFFPLLEKMGVGVERSLARAGFYPAGGGQMRVSVKPSSQLGELSLLERGALRRVYAQVLIANLPHHVARRELSAVQERLSLTDEDLQLRTPEANGPGNVLLLIAEHEHALELITTFGEKNLSAERVAERGCTELAMYLRSGAPVGEHLADQLLIPMAMAGRGAFITCTLSAHTRSNMQIVQRFLPVRFLTEAISDTQIRISVEAASK